MKRPLSGGFFYLRDWDVERFVVITAPRSSGWGGAGKGEFAKAHDRLRILDLADMGSSPFEARGKGAGPLLRAVAQNKFESHVGAKLLKGAEAQGVNCRG